MRHFQTTTRAEAWGLDASLDELRREIARRRSDLSLSCGVQSLITDELTEVLRRREHGDLRQCG